MNTAHEIENFLTYLTRRRSAQETAAVIKKVLEVSELYGAQPMTDFFDLPADVVAKLAALYTVRVQHNITEEHEWEVVELPCGITLNSYQRPRAK